MKIVIIGAGAVGFDLAREISEREHDVYVVEQEPERLAEVQETIDCHLVVGNGIAPDILDSVGMDDTDLFAAVTNRDEINIISCLTAHKLGARVKVARVRQEEYYRDQRLVLDGIDLAINPDSRRLYLAVLPACHVVAPRFPHASRHVQLALASCPPSLRLL